MSKRLLPDRQAARHRRPRPRHCAGISLVEMLVAVAVGAIVVLGLADILANTSATYTREEAFARLQENGRIASLIAAREMRPNRSTDCKSVGLHQAQGSLTVKACDLLEPGCTLGAHYLDINRPLGFDNSAPLTAPDSYDLPTDIAASIADRWALGDVLVTWGVDPDGTPLDGALGDGASGTDDGTGRVNLLSTPGNLQRNDLALVSNCQYAHVFEVTGPENIGTYVEHTVNAGDGKANAVDHLRGTDVYAGSAPYNRELGDPRGQLYPLVYKVFYVCCVSDGSLQTGGDVDGCRPTHADYDPANYRPALCVYNRQFDESQRNQVLVPEVADMRVTYSGDSNGDGTLDFRAEDAGIIPTAAWVTNNNAWAGVRSAVVELLLAADSESPGLTESRPANSDWPPNTDSSIDDDTLGAGYPKARQLYQRFRFEVALRPSTLWTAKY